MPIRLNLLAEAQAEMELRRRDPVKRGIWIAVFLVCCVLAWSSTLQIRILTQRSSLNHLESRFESKGSKYQKIIQTEHDLADLNSKLKSLNNLTTNRFLWGNVLNALQKSTLEDVQLTHFRSEQSYVVTEEVKNKTLEDGRVKLGRPGGITQKLTFFLDAKDTSPNPGDQIDNYKAALAKASFFGSDHGNTNNVTFALKNLSAPTYDPENGKTVIFFSIECRFADEIIQ